MGYVDDIEFIDQNKYTLEAILPKVEMVFKDRNLMVNPNKTDFIDVIISENKNDRGNEPWRNNEILGSKLCSVKDIENRIQLTNVA